VTRDKWSALTPEELRLYVASLDGKLSAAQAELEDLRAKKGKNDDETDSSFVDPSPEELQTWAKECRIKIDAPPIFGSEPPPKMTQSALDRRGLSADEGQAVMSMLESMQREWKIQVAAYYIEATGDQTQAEVLSTRAMTSEIEASASEKERALLQQRMAQERAGLLPVPTDLSKASPYERYFREFADMGNETERRVAQIIGPEKAHQMRMENGGWGQKMSMSGCPSPEGSPVDD